MLAPHFKTVAYSYIGPELTYPIYTNGSIGKAKQHLQATSDELNRLLMPLNGQSLISVNKALVTQSSSAIPVVPLYMSILFKIMKEQKPMGGRIINNGSISSHSPRPDSAPYTSTKHAITGLTRSTSLDGRQYDIACGQIDIGNASTEMTTSMEKGIIQANGNIDSEPTMNTANVAKALVYMANLPLDTNVPFMTVMANKMPFIGRG